MAKYEARANGRKVGAIGIFHVLPPITFEYDGGLEERIVVGMLDNTGLRYSSKRFNEKLEDAARMAYYGAGFEHINLISITKIEN